MAVKDSSGYVLVLLKNKTPKVVSVGCIGLWKHNGVVSRLMEQNKTKHPLALSRVEPRVTKFDKVPMFYIVIQDESLIFQDALDTVKN